MRGPMNEDQVLLSVTEDRLSFSVGCRTVWRRRSTETPARGRWF